MKMRPRHFRKSLPATFTNMKAMLVLLFLGCALSARAADSLRILASRPMSARSITTDELGNIYAIQKDNTLARYNAQGDSTGFYRSALNGQLGSVDATNPLRLLLYFPAFNKVQVLDRQLALKAEVDLRPLRIFSPTAIATASDGNIWVYDPVNARLLKLDETGARIQEGIDLRQQLSFVPKAGFLLERDRRLYLCDTAHGILVFDPFASYITTLPFRPVASLQAFNHQLVFRRGNTLCSYDMQTFGEQLLPLPEDRQQHILGACLSSASLAVLYEKSLVIYALPEGHSAR